MLLFVNKLHTEQFVVSWIRLTRQIVLLVVKWLGNSADKRTFTSSNDTGNPEFVSVHDLKNRMHTADLHTRRTNQLSLFFIPTS